MTRLPLLPGLLLLMLMAQAAWGQSTGYSTPEDNVIEQRMPDVPLEQGQLRFSVLPGYRDEVNNLHYAFPVGNSALGRTWATGRDLSWQVANGYSVVPVLVEFEHRMASAQQVRVEVITTRPYAREELQAYGGDSAEDLSSQLAVFSGEMLVPPSVPSSFVLTPRYIPDVPPGTAVYMQVYIYFNNSPVPTWSRKLDVVVLNPAHLYFLHLDAEPGQPEELVVNPANQLRLGKLAEPGFDPSVLSSLLYGMPVDRRVVTGAPLAARDFAFVCADARQVRDWPQEEQDALEGFMLGGGRLCLYNMQGSWRGYAGHDSPVGRGFLLAQAGDYQAAKQQMLGWLEGELEEFVLLAGGSVRGYDVPSQGGNSIFGSPGLDLDQVYGTDPLAGTLPSQRPGFLHPVMLYREISSDNAIEPWDFPEYQLSRPRQTGQLTNRLALDSVLDSRQQREAALLEAAVPSRPFPLLLLAVLAVPLLAMLLLRRSRGRRQWLATAVACLMCLIAWLAGQPMEFHPVRLRLLDRDLRSDVADSRRLSVVMADSHGRSRLQMPPAALVRRVVSSPPGSISLDGSRNESVISSVGRAEIANIYVDAFEPQPEAFPAGVELVHEAPGRSRLTIDTSNLATGQSCVLQTPLGFQRIAAGSDPVGIILRHPEIPVHPGLERIRVLREIHEENAGQGNPNVARFSGMLDNLRQEISAEAKGSLAEICWDGLLRQPLGLFGDNISQVVVYVVDAGESLSEQGVQEITVQRMCLPLGGLV